MLTKKEVIEKYGDVELKFTNYYKYVFYFKWIAPDGAQIIGTIGDTPDDIYEQDIRHDETYRVRDVSWAFHTLTIEKDQKQLFYWNSDLEKWDDEDNAQGFLWVAKQQK